MIFYQKYKFTNDQFVSLTFLIKRIYIYRWLKVKEKKFLNYPSQNIKVHFPGTIS